MVRSYHQSRHYPKPISRRHETSARKWGCHILSGLREGDHVTKVIWTQRSQFVRHIILFNETFSPVGGHADPLGNLWHKGIRGQNDEDIASVFIKFLTNHDAADIVFWLDNCTGQNKNWTLFGGFTLFCPSGNQLLQTHHSTIPRERSYVHEC